VAFRLGTRKGRDLSDGYFFIVFVVISLDAFPVDTCYDGKIIVLFIRGILMYHVAQNLFLLVNSNHIQCFLDISCSLLCKLLRINIEIKALGTCFGSMWFALMHRWCIFNNLTSFLQRCLIHSTLRRRHRRLSLQLNTRINNLTTIPRISQFNTLLTALLKFIIGQILRQINIS